jgi:hypothetical protein
MARTLGEARKLGWRVRVRCYVRGVNPKAGHRNSIVLCDTTAELDMKTLVWTRGEHMPLDDLRERMKCPSRGSRQVTVWFEVPNQPIANRAAE